MRPIYFRQTKDESIMEGIYEKNLTAFQQPEFLTDCLNWNVLPFNIKITEDSHHAILAVFRKTGDKIHHC